MKAGTVKVKVLTGANAAALEAAINTFLEGLDEQSFLDLRFAADATNGLHVVITYTE